MKFNNKKIKLLRNIVFFFGVLVMAGCSIQLPSQDSLISQTADFQLPKLPEEGQAVMYVVRLTELGNAVRMSVYLDDVEVGYTKGKQYIYFELPLGKHIITSKSENVSKINISAKNKEIIFLQQEVLVGTAFARNNLKRIEALAGKYYVKKLELGKIDIKPYKKSTYDDTSSTLVEDCPQFNSKKKSVIEKEIAKQNLTCLYKFYYWNGKLAQTRNYKNGKREGEWKWYYKNGILSGDVNWKDGHYEGEWKIYHKNGRLYQSGSYNKYGEREGKLRSYLPNGKLDFCRILLQGYAVSSC